MPEIPATQATTITATAGKPEDGLCRVSIETQHPAPYQDVDHINSSKQTDQFIAREIYEKFQSIAKAVTQKAAERRISPENPDPNGYNIMAATITTLVKKHNIYNAIAEGTPEFNALVATAQKHQALSPDAMAEKMEEALYLANAI